MSTHLPHLNRRVLTVFLLVSLPIFVVGVALVLTIGQTRLRDAGGRHLEDVARQTAASVDTYVYRRILDVTLVGRTPELRREAAASNAAAFVQARVDALDAAWRNRDKDPGARATVLRTPASRYLADLVAHDPIYREMLLTDRSGRLVAASGETTDYFQADEDWWQAAAGPGHAPGTSVSDVRWDPETRTHALEIAVPVYEPESEAFAGLLKATVDSRELLAAVGGVQIGSTGEAALLRRNGSIVFSRRTSDPNARFVGAETLRERLATAGADDVLAGTFFRAVPQGEPGRMVGIAPSQLARSYENLGWIVAVSQAEDELLQPVRRAGWYMLGVLALTVLAFLLAAFWMSWQLATPLEEDLQLVEHTPVTHVGDADEDVPPRDVPPSVRIAG